MASNIFGPARTRITSARKRHAEVSPSRGVLTGALIYGIFGIAWAEWGASGLSGGVAEAFRIVGIVVGVVVIARSVRLRRSLPTGSPTMFASSTYWWVVALEVAALIGGNAALGVTGHGGYVAAWVAFVVGAHFMAFGRFFHGGFYRLGTAILLGALAGTAVGLTGGGADGIEATTGLIAATSLLAAGMSRVSGKCSPLRPVD